MKATGAMKIRRETTPHSLITRWKKEHKRYATESDNLKNNALTRWQYNGIAIGIRYCLNDLERYDRFQHKKPKTNMRTQMNDIDTKQKRIELVLKIVGACVLGFLFAPFALATIKGLAGLIFTLVAGGFCIQVGIPWYARSLANWKLKALKAAAAANPIETLENSYKQRQEALVTIRNGIQSFKSSMLTFQATVDEQAKIQPAAAHKYDEQMRQMQLLLQVRKQKYKDAQVQLEAFAQFIEQKRSEWKIAQAAASMSKAAGVSEEFFNKLMSDTAIDTINTGLNNAFAELELSLDDEYKPAPPPAQVSAPLPEPKQLPDKRDTSLDLDLDAEPAKVIAMPKQ